MAKALRAEWLEIKRLSNQLHIDTNTPPNNDDVTGSNEYSFGSGIKKLSSKIRKNIQQLQFNVLSKKAESLPKSDPRRICATR